MRKTAAIPAFRMTRCTSPNNWSSLELTPDQAEAVLKRLGAGVVEKLALVEGIGWQARIEPVHRGVTIHFRAHDELLDDLLRRFEQQAEREA